MNEGVKVKHIKNKIKIYKTILYANNHRIENDE